MLKLEDIWGHKAVFLQEDIHSSSSISEIITKVEAKWALANPDLVEHLQAGASLYEAGVIVITKP